MWTIMIYCYTLATQESLISVIIWAMFGVCNNSPPPAQSHSPHHRSHASNLAGHWTSFFLSPHVYDPKSFCYNEDLNKFQLIFYCFWDWVSRWSSIDSNLWGSSWSPSPRSWGSKCEPLWLASHFLKHHLLQNDKMPFCTHGSTSWSIVMWMCASVCTLPTELFHLPRPNSAPMKQKFLPQTP